MLVRRIFDSWNGNFETLDVADTFHHTVGDVGDALKALFPGLSVAYGDSAGYALPASDVARVRYGWFQRYDLLRGHRPHSNAHAACQMPGDGSRLGAL